MTQELPYLNTNIYLVGMPGAGKSTIGRLLAKKINYDFCDLDRFIENKSGTFINDFFDAWGEDTFRLLERDTLLETAKMKKNVVACGGGTAAFHNNMEWMNSNGITVYLHTDLDTILQRLSRNKKKRPLFNTLSPEELAGKIAELYAKRDSFYRKSKMIVTTTNKEEVCDKIVNQIIANNCF